MMRMHVLPHLVRVAPQKLLVRWIVSTANYNGRTKWINHMQPIRMTDETVRDIPSKPNYRAESQL